MVGINDYCNGESEYVRMIIMICAPVEIWCAMIQDDTDDSYHFVDIVCFD